MTAVLAAATLAAALVLLLPGDPAARLHRLAGASSPAAPARSRGGLPPLLIARGRREIAGVRSRFGSRRRLLRRREAALEVCDAFAAELRAGRSVRAALVRAAEGVGEPCPAAVAACALGGDVVAALRADAGSTRVRVWSSLAACWSVGEGSGAGLAAAVDRLVASARSEEEVRREITAALAAPRATAQVLAVLPVFGMVLGTALGANPVAWLLGSTVGVAVLAAGVAAAVAGVVWTGRIARGVEQQL